MAVGSTGFGKSVVKDGGPSGQSQGGDACRMTPLAPLANLELLLPGLHSSGLRNCSMWCCQVEEGARCLFLKTVACHIFVTMCVSHDHSKKKVVIRRTNADVQWDSRIIYTWEHSITIHAAPLP